MKKILLLFATITTTVLFASSAGHAQAASASATVNITATILSSCTINGSANGGSQTLDFSNTTASPSSTISTTKQTAVFAVAICNTPSHITLKSASGHAANAASAPTGYQNYFDYTATATWNNVSDTLVTATDGSTLKTSVTAAPAGVGPLTVDVTPTAPALQLVSGGYADVLTVTLTAN